MLATSRQRTLITIKGGGGVDIAGIQKAIDLIEKDMKEKFNNLANLNIELNILKMELNNIKTNYTNK